MTEPLTVWRVRHQQETKELTFWTTLLAITVVAAVVEFVLWLTDLASDSPKAVEAAAEADWLMNFFAVVSLLPLGVTIFLMSRKFEPFCEVGDCNAHLSLLKPWTCGYCSEVNNPDHRRAGHTYFGTCRGCGRSPPALQCHRCGHVNVILEDTPVAEQNTNYARGAIAGGVAPTDDEEAAARHKASMTGLGRDTEFIRAETRKFEAAVERRDALRKLAPPDPERPESPAEAVRREVREYTAKTEALLEARAERLADLERRYAGDPETLKTLRDLLDANTERMRVKIAQER